VVHHHRPGLMMSGLLVTQLQSFCCLLMTGWFAGVLRAAAWWWVEQRAVDGFASGSSCRRSCSYVACWSLNAAEGSAQWRWGDVMFNHQDSKYM